LPHPADASDTEYFPCRTFYKEALKYGFYEMQMARDWYREVTADVGMHVDLVKYWVRTSVLLVTPIAPHFAEHIWGTVFKEPTSVQLARWPEPSGPVDRAMVEAGAYMRGTIKTIRDAELALLKKAGKGKGGPAPFDPKKPRAVRVYVASRFPEWQDACVAIIKEAYAEEAERVDDAKVRELLMKLGLIKDKRAMPFIQAFKVRSGAGRFLHSILTQVHAETHGRDRCQVCLPANVVLQRDRGSAGAVAILEEVVEPGGRGGVARRRSADKGGSRFHQDDH
jgi:leucyl-tRNA synthetase